MRMTPPLWKGTPWPLVKEISFFNSWSYTSLLLINGQSLIFIIRSVWGGLNNRYNCEYGARIKCRRQ